MARRGSRAAVTARRQARNIDRAAMERQQHYVYTRCWICGSEFVVNNTRDLKVRTKEHELAGHLICANCRCVVNGRLITKSGIDWARSFVQMYLLAKKTADLPCQLRPGPDLEQTCKCAPCTASRLIQQIDSERPPRRLYRKRRSATEV